MDVEDRRAHDGGECRQNMIEFKLRCEDQQHL